MGLRHVRSVWQGDVMVEQLDDVTIRPAAEGDAAGIARVHVRSWQEAYAGIVPEAYLASLDVDQRDRASGRPTCARVRRTRCSPGSPSPGPRRSAS